MTAPALIERALRSADVEAAALFGADRSVLHRGFGAHLPALSEVAATLRHVFKETSPAVRTLDLRFADGRIVVLPIDDDVLVLRTSSDASVEALVAELSVERTAERVYIDTRQRPQTPRAPVLARAPSARDAAPARAEDAPPTLALDALARLVEHARQGLGGPVIRNYLRKARERLGAPEALRPFEIELSGKVGARDPVADPETVRAVGRWARTFLALAGTVAPDIAAVELRALMGELAPRLERLGFFDAD